MPTIPLTDQLARTEREIERCRLAACDPGVSTLERWGASLGEADWLVNREMILEEIALEGVTRKVMVNA